VSQPQFTVKSFARGVKLTVQHAWTPAQQIQSAAQSSAVEGQQVLAPTRMSWTFTPDSETFGSTHGAKVVLPMILPPPQDEFNVRTRSYSAAPQLYELSISFDQRAQAAGITDSWCVWPFNTQKTITSSESTLYPMPGQLAEVDLSRYDTVLRLVQKVPTVLDTDGDSLVHQDVLALQVPGAALFGAGFNPYVIDGLSVYLNPYGAYYWVMETPGLTAPQGTDVIQQSALQVIGTPVGAYPETYDCYLSLSGLVSIGDTFTINSTGGGPYVYTATGVGVSRQDIIDGLLDLAVGDTVWTFTDAAKTYGTAGLGHIIATHKVPGTTVDVITTATTCVVATFTSTNASGYGHVGTNGNFLSVVDNNSHTYQYDLLPTDTIETAAAGLAAAINGHDGYTATSQSSVVLVQNDPGVSFSFTQGTNDNDNVHVSPCFVWFVLSRPLLAMPNLTLVASMQMPLSKRDYSESTNPAVSPYVQNIPTKHLGKMQAGTMALPAVPAADATITGDDWQGLVTALEQPLLNGLRSGYGRDPGSEGDVFPWEQQATDAGYQVINVQMFPNWWDVRRRSINPKAAGANTWEPGQGGYVWGVGFPYLSGSPPYVNPVCDQRIIAVPEGFVLHHVIVAQNCFPYPDNRVWPQGSAWGGLFTGTQKVGVGLYNGLRSDNLKFQQVAYLEWTNDIGGGGADRKFVVDELLLDSKHRNYVLFNCPLVWPDNTNGTHSYGGLPVGSGHPFWMGQANSNTQSRTQVGDMPFAFGGGALAAPRTLGSENLLVVRWSLEDAAGLGNPAKPDEVLCGPGGHQVILIGKQSVVGSDTGGKVVSSNPVVGTW
jgi:hypothetical protein